MILILLPILMTSGALLTVTALLWQARRTRDREEAARSRKLDAPAGRPARTPLPPSVQDAPQTGRLRTGVNAQAGSAPPASPPPADPAARTGELADAIARAQASGQKSRLAELHLSLGTHLLGHEQLAAAAAELRKAILAAVPQHQHGTHAAARLALGDIAEREGDLTTACEHWQIARSLFQELSAREPLRDAQQRMRRIDCPTDWVLNDF